ncbi:MAG TPA: trypsin-like peptidase domain-containing protein [Gemmatimonadales bacterium]|jgi:serine protease Do
MSTRSRNWIKFGALVALAFVLGLFFAGLLDFPRTGFAQERAAHTPIVKVDAPRIPAARALVDLSDAYAAVVDAVRPSVVYIQSESPMSADDQAQIVGQLPPGFQQLIPRGQQQQRRRPTDAPELEHSSGSGFIVSSDGYILTNNHVIEGSSKVTVRLLDGREYTAKIVGTDKDTDIGVLKIDAMGLTPAALGSSDATRVGEWVLAIGNPLGGDLTFTVTQGIVSAKGRANLALGDRDGGKLIQDYIQTDAVINKGNSGGPLVNVRGEVIGINAAIASQTGYYTGYAFAVPIDLARKVMDQLVSSGHVERAGLGVFVQDADRDDADYLGLPSIAGVRIESYSQDNSPAKAAGIEPGDVIVSIDGQPVKYTSQLQQIVGFRRPGDVVKIELYRKDGKHTASVKLISVDQPSTVADAATSDSPRTTDANSTSKNVLGLITEPLTATLAQQAGLPTTSQGLLIESVIDGSPASTHVICSADVAGQECGAPDVIVSVEGKPVKNEADLKAALGSAVHNVVTLELMAAGPDKDHKPATHVERIRIH